MPTAPQRTLRCYYNWLATQSLSTPHGGWLKAIHEAGYDGVQFIEPLDADLVAASRDLGLGVCGSGRVNRPADSFRLAEEGARAELECLTLHVGWGIEEDDVAAQLIESVLSASAKSSLPLYVETHRATLFQDMWRTVQFIRRYPQLRFNGDFSHWYTGQEMVYGDFEQKLEFLRPVIQRVRFMHGRIGNPGCMQVDIGDLEPASALPYVQHFRRMWTEVFRAWIAQDDTLPAFCFAAELLASDIFYARVFQGREESDRWEQSLVITQLARDCFVDARRSSIQISQPGQRGVAKTPTQ